MTAQPLALVKKPILLVDLLVYERVDRVIIESLEQALYCVSIHVNGEAFYVVEEVNKQTKMLVRRSIVEIQALLIPLSIQSMFLKHTSSYDEMIGLDEKEHSNELLVPLGNYFDDEKNAVKH